METGRRNGKSPNFDPADHAAFLRSECAGEKGREIIKKYIGRAVGEGNVDDVFLWAMVAAHYCGHALHPDEMLSFDIQQHLREFLYTVDAE